MPKSRKRNRQLNRTQGAARPVQPAAPPRPLEQAAVREPEVSRIEPTQVATRPSNGESKEVTWAVKPEQLEPIPTTAPTLRSLAEGVTLEWALYALFFVVAVLLRFASLDAHPLTNSEAGTSLAAWQLAQGQASGAYHSPFLFTLNFFTFLLLGGSDLAARFIPALLGSAVVLLPIFLRRELGRVSALLSCALLVFSPTLVFFARQVEGAEIGAGAGFLAAVLLWRAWESRFENVRALYWAMAAAAIAWTTSSVSFTVLLGGLAFALVYAFVSRRGVARRITAEAYSNGPISDEMPSLALADDAPIESKSPWLRALLIFGAVYVASATAFLLNRGGLGAAFTLFGDWLSMFSVIGPLNAPLNLLLVYEPLTLIFGFAGLVLALTLRSDEWSERALLVFLGITAIVGFVFYSVAGVKDPANVVVLVIPLMLLAGWFIGSLVERGVEEISRGQGGLSTIVWGELPIIVLALIFASLLYLQFVTFFQQNHFSPGVQALYNLFSANAPEGSLTGATIVLAGLTVIVLLVVGGLSVLAIGASRTTNLAAIIVALLLTLSTVRTVWLLNFSGNDTTHELVSPAQTSLQVRDLVRDIENESQWRANEPHVIQVRADVALDVVVRWYLREFPNLKYVEGLATRGVTDLSKDDPRVVLTTTSTAPPGEWVSQHYRVELEWQPQNLRGADLMKWLLFRAGGVEEWQSVTLWATPPPTSAKAQVSQ
jgi:uncharacterized protein (TIGR03663 family)